jgi:heme/copper-type cytochrome/quinol oxidase subunit 1
VSAIASPYPTPAAEQLRPTGLLRWVTTVDHKDIGVLYLVTSAAFLLVG